MSADDMASSLQNEQPEQARLAHLARLEGYLAHDAANPHLLADLADGYMQLRHWDDAQRILQQTLALLPTDGPARYRMAVVARALGRTDEALALLQALVAEGVDAAPVRQELALNLAGTGDWIGVNAALQPFDLHALRAVPPEQADDLVMLRLRALHHTGELDRALELGVQWQTTRGTALPVELAAALATLALDAERLDTAAQLLAQYGDEAAFGRSAELRTAAGFVAMLEGNVTAASAHFARSAAQAPAMGRAQLGAGLAAAVGGDLVSAKAALVQATAAMPSHLGSWHALAWMQLLADEIDAAQATFDKAMAQDRTFGDTHGGLALVAALRGDRPAAEERLRVAQRLDPQSMNAAVARIVLAQGHGLKQQDVLREGLAAFMARSAQQNDGSAALLQRVMASILSTNPTRH